MAFDRSYYQRFYFDPRTAVTTRTQVARRARLVAAALRYLDLPVRSILDAGCGVGAMRAPLLRALPGARYLGLEVSDYLCARYGWKQGAIQDFRSRQRFDLVICDDVLQYLDDRAARRALRALARACRGALFFGALTEEDWNGNCDRAATDETPWIRPAEWYRKELRRSFTPAGCGVWIRLGTPVVLWELDRG